MRSQTALMKHFLLILFCISAALCRAQINTDRMLDVGRNALYFEDYALSIQYFNRIIASKPYLYEPYFYRAVAKFYLEDYTGAEADCSKAISINPFYPNPYELRGLARINLQQYDAAAHDYERATKENPEQRGLWRNWVLCNLERDSRATADSIAESIILRWPKHADGYMLKAQTRLAAGDTLEAEQFIDTALINDRYNVPSLSLKANMLMRREVWPEADSVLTEAIRLQPRNTGNLLNRALTRYHMNNLRGAMADYDAALSIDPTNFTGHYNRGLLRARVGEDNLAIEDFDFILRITPDDVMCIYNRAELRMATGDYQGAIEDYTKLIQTYPNFLLGYEQRAIARRRIGDTAGAARDENFVLQEQIYHRYGIATKTSRRGATTRKKSEVDLSEYQKLVVDDEEEDKVYESEYRGKIQNKTADDSPQGPASLPEYRRHDAVADALFDKGLEHLLMKEYDAAITQFSACIETGKAPAEAYYNRAFALTQALSSVDRTSVGREQVTAHIARATEDLNRAITLLPSFGQAYFNRGLLHLQRGDNEAATQDLSTAGELGIYRAYSLLKQSQSSKSTKK
jgi:tetratricopeptide (TPR) repeat protein